MNQFSLKKALLSLSTALVLGLVGCSSGGGSSSSTSDDGTVGGGTDSGGGDSSVSTSYSGIGIDGILVGSTVCIDVNQNNACETDEPSAITDAEGKFNIAETTLSGPLLLLGGIDNSTGAAFTGSLKAPAGSSVVTPLTSAVQSLVESGKSAQEAEANVKAAMGLTDVDLTTFDPYAEISGVNAAKAQEVLAKQTQLQVLVHAATVTVAGADAGTDVNSTMSSVFDAIVENFSGATSEVVLDATVVSAATKKAADTVYADKPVARVAAKVVAQTSAENSVRDADNAEQTITDGTPSEAVDSLDAAIAKANTTAEAEARLAAENAKAAADALTAEKIAEIEALQRLQQEKEAEIAAARAAQAAAQAELAAAKAAAEADAANREKYEAFLVAQAEAETAAKEKAQADLAAAQAQAAAAEQEALIAAEAAQRQAQAQAAAAQAQAEADAALLREAAAQQAAADAQAAVDLAAAQQAAADAQAAAAIQIAQAEVNANVQIANFFATQASQDATATRALADLAITGNLADDNATAAETARDAALQAALDADIQLPADNNISASITAKLEAETHAALAATALANAQQIKSDAELAAAVLIAQEAKRARIIIIRDSVVTLFNDANASFSDFNTSAITDNVDFVEDVANAYPNNTELQEAWDNMQVADTAGGDAYQEAGVLLSDIDLQIALIGAAIVDLNELAAADAKDAALVAKGSLETLLSLVTTHVDEIASIRVRVEEIRDTEIANEQQRVAAAIEAYRVSAQGDLNATVSAANDANVSAITAETAAATAESIAAQDANASTYATTARSAADDALDAANAAATQAQEASALMLSTFDQNVTETSAQDAVTAIAANKAEAQRLAGVALDNAGIAAQELALAQAVITPPDNGLAFSDGFSFGGFNIDYDGVSAEYVTLSGAPEGIAAVVNYKLDANSSTFIEDSSFSDSDYILNAGVWELEDNGDTNYTIQGDGSVVLANGETIKVVQEVNLTTVADGTNDDFVNGVNMMVPGDENVTYSVDAKAYIFASKSIDAYRLYWTPEDENNATYSSVLDFMTSGSPVAGIETAAGYMGVNFETNSSVVVDSTNTEVTTLTEGLFGYLTSEYTGDVQRVATWTVIALPDSGALALEVNATDLNAFGDEVDNLIAQNLQSPNDAVMIGEITQASADFEIEAERIHFNQVAFDDIKAAIETAVQTPTTPAGTPTPNDSPAVGAWVAGNDMNITLVIADNEHYFFAQGVEDGGVAGGIEIGIYISNIDTDGTLSGFSADVNTSGEDSIVGATLTFNDSGDSNISNDTLEVNGLVLTRLQEDSNPVIGAYAFEHDDGNLSMLIFTADGQYMVADTDFSAPGEMTDSESNGDLANAFERGTYVINSSTATDMNVTFTAPAESDFNGGSGLAGETIIIDTQLYPVISMENGQVVLKRIQPNGPFQIIDDSGEEFSLETFFVGQIVYTMDENSSGDYYATTMSFAADSNLAGGTDADGSYGIDAGASDHTYEINGDIVTLVDDENVTTTLTYLYHDDQSNGEQFRLTFYDVNGSVAGEIEGPFFDNEQDRDDFLTVANAP